MFHIKVYIHIIRWHNIESTTIIQGHLSYTSFRSDMIIWWHYKTSTKTLTTCTGILLVTTATNNEWGDHKLQGTIWLTIATSNILNLNVQSIQNKRLPFCRGRSSETLETNNTCTVFCYMTSFVLTLYIGFFHSSVILLASRATKNFVGSFDSRNFYPKSITILLSNLNYI